MDLETFQWIMIIVGLLSGVGVILTEAPLR